MSETPTHAPAETVPVASEASDIMPAIKEAQTGYFRWVWLTLKNKTISIKNAFRAVLWRFPKFVAYDYPRCQLKVLFGDKDAGLKGSNLWRGISFALKSENYRIFGGGHGGGGEEEGGGGGHH